jgi:hypothetical protein
MSRPTSAPSGDTGQQSRPRDMGRDDQMDGQHRTYGTGAPGEQTGQTSHHRPGANVGQKTGAGGWDVPAVPADADIPRGTVIESGTLGKDKS